MAGNLAETIALGVVMGGDLNKWEQTGLNFIPTLQSNVDAEQLRLYGFFSGTLIAETRQMLNDADNFFKNGEPVQLGEYETNNPEQVALATASALYCEILDVVEMPKNEEHRWYAFIHNSFELSRGSRGVRQAHSLIIDNTNNDVYQGTYTIVPLEDAAHKYKLQVHIEQVANIHLTRKDVLQNLQSKIQVPAVRAELGTTLAMDYFDGIAWVGSWHNSFTDTAGVVHMVEKTGMWQSVMDERALTAAQMLYQLGEIDLEKTRVFTARDGFDDPPMLVVVDDGDVTALYGLAHANMMRTHKEKLFEGVRGFFAGRLDTLRQQADGNKFRVSVSSMLAEFLGVYFPDMEQHKQEQTLEDFRPVVYQAIAETFLHPNDRETFLVMARDSKEAQLLVTHQIQMIK